MIRTDGEILFAQEQGRGKNLDAIQFDEGSFRDRSSRIFTSGGEIYRALTRESDEIWQSAAQQPHFLRMMESGQIVGTRSVPPDEFGLFDLPREFVAAIKHETIPFISYPYEWSFGMLRDAALLHLNLTKELIGAGMMLKDASPYNIQFRAAQPVFIDLGSLTRFNPGEPWIAYRQFCELMLFPLLLQAYRGIDFQPLLRSQLEGISTRQFVQLMRWRDLFRPGVFAHGFLQSLLERTTRSLSTSAVSDLQSSGFDASLILKMIDKLIRVIARLRWNPPETQWTQYDNSLTHVADDLAAKSTFVREVCQSRHRHQVWDLGCNDGRFSQIAADYSTAVIAVDQDHACVERLYRSLRPGAKNILTLCVNLANPSPAQGWRGAERKRLEQRGRPDLVLCLGLIHHLVIAANIPLSEVISWLAGVGGELVLEFPTKDDAMVRSLLKNKRDQYADYSRENLLREMEKYYRIRRTVDLPSGHRTMVHAGPKSDG